MEGPAYKGSLRLARRRTSTLQQNSPDFWTFIFLCGANHEIMKFLELGSLSKGDKAVKKAYIRF